MDAVTKKRVEEVKEVIKSLEEWAQYVSDLNECAYSDDMLLTASKKLKTIYDDMPF